MPRYKVEIIETMTSTVYLDADNPEQAKDLAYGKNMNGKYQSRSIDFDEFIVTEEPDQETAHDKRRPARQGSTLSLHLAAG